MTKKEIKEMALARGIYCATYAPGDGVTRYRFFKEKQDYFGGSGYDRLYTALGAKEAFVWLTGFQSGQSVARTEVS